MSKRLHYKKSSYIAPEVFFREVSGYPGVIFLDSSDVRENSGRYSFVMFEPLISYLPTKTLLKINNNKNLVLHNKIEDALEEWQKIYLQNKNYTDLELPPFTGGFVGYFSYDLSKQIEEISSFSIPNVPGYCIGLYNKVFAFDHIKQECFIFVNEIDGFVIDAENELNRLELLYKSATDKFTGTDSTTENIPPITLQSNFTKAKYKDMLAKARNYILNGDVYEINLAQCLSAKIGSTYPKLSLYLHLRQKNKAPFSAYLDFSYLFKSDFQILSLSPERFLAVKDNKIEARPIKGTIKSSSDHATDQQLIKMLENSEKDRAENIMIVDLLRNDLGKICKARSVNVSQLCGIESYTNLHHMVSVINGELRADKSIFDVILAAFPGGSVTGAPKIRAMQLIEELEKTARGVYCGSIGYFGFNGNIDFNITIRTISIVGEELRLYSGGAITLDSDFDAEYDETMLKVQKIAEVLNCKI